MNKRITFRLASVAFLFFLVVTGLVNTPKAKAESVRQKDEQTYQESVYTIQTGSFKDIQRAKRHFSFIEQSLEETALQALRIEKIEQWYAVRIGKFISLPEAEQFLRDNKPTPKEAIVRKAYFINERIVLIHDDIEGDFAEVKDELPVDQNSMDIPQAANDLGIKLIGTVLANEPGDSMAIIESLTSGNQEVYKEGDTLQNILIKRILSRRVIIDEGNGDEMLTMVRETTTDTFPLESPRVQIGKKEVDNTIPTYSQMMRLIRLRPYRREGRLGGFIIYNIKPESIFERMGFENGDVITRVRGKPIMVTQEAVNFYHTIRQGGDVCIDIKRDDTDQKLCFEIK